MVALQICQLNQQIIHGLHSDQWMNIWLKWTKTADTQLGWKGNRIKQKKKCITSLLAIACKFGYIWLQIVVLVKLYFLIYLFVSRSHHIQMDDDAPGNIVLLGEIVFVHHPRADPLQFLSWMGHSKFYVGTLHVIYRWHIWSTFGSYNIKWKSEGDFLKAVA